MNNRHLLRLNPDDPLCWEVWPYFEQRLQEVMPTLCHDSTFELLKAPLRRAFAGDLPNFLMLALVDPDMKIDGHLVGWLDNAWGKNYAFIHQVQCDIPAGPFWPGAITEIRQWVDRMNHLGANPKITEIKWVTSRGDGWAGLIREAATREHVIMTVPVDKLSRSRS